MTDELVTIRLDRRLTEERAGYVDSNPTSQALAARANDFLPGGNTRSVLHFDPFPFRVRRADGPYLHDVDGHQLVDLLGNYTAGLLGHSPTELQRALSGRLESGWALGATHETEIEAARLICERFAGIEKVRFTNSGTEANLMAIGLAKHHTGRSKVFVFERGYHGGVLSFGAGDADSGVHNRLNVPHEFVVVPFNDIDAFDRAFADNPGNIAAVLVEPMQGSGGCTPAADGFLEHLRAVTSNTDTVLIFDEVMTSRLSPGGAQQLFGVIPDLTTLGKYLAGGLTFGAFGGRADLLNHFDPAGGGPLTQAGTFNNNVLSMQAVVTTLTSLLTAEVLEAVNSRGERLREELTRLTTSLDVPIRITGVGSLMNLHDDGTGWLEFLFFACLNRGFYFAPRGFIALSMAITDDHVDQFLAVIDEAVLSVTR